MPERIEVIRFGCSQEAEYIHKYYLPKECLVAITPQDVDALIGYVPLSWREHEPSWQVKSMLSDGVVLFYKDIGCEKSLTAEQVKTVFSAVAAWSDEVWSAELTDEETQAAIALNERLTLLEKEIRDECVRLDNELQARVQRGDGFESDYEILVDVEFYMDETHPEYSEDFGAESIIRLEWMPFKELAARLQDDDYWGVGDEKDHNHIRSRNHPEHPLWGGPHCRLFHELDDHSPMPMKHACRIGRIWAEIRVWHQKLVDLK